MEATVEGAGKNRDWHGLDDTTREALPGRKPAQSPVGGRGVLTGVDHHPINTSSGLLGELRTTYGVATPIFGLGGGEDSTERTFLGVQDSSFAVGDVMKAFAMLTATVLVVVSMGVGVLSARTATPAMVTCNWSFRACDHYVNAFGLAPGAVPTDTALRFDGGYIVMGGWMVDGAVCLPRSDHGSAGHLDYRATPPNH